MTIDCPHWSRASNRGQGACAVGKFGGAPWPGNCQACIARGENVAGKPTDWPLALRTFKLAARSGDRGLGDIVARFIGPVGGDAYKTWFETTFGRSCGCTDRRLWLNTRYPLPAR